MPALSTYPWARIALVVVILTTSFTPLPLAGAQEAGEVSLELVGQPVWHEPGDPLGLRLRIDNSGASSLEGFSLQVRAYSHANSRSELHENFEIDPLRIESDSLRVDRTEISVPGGTVRTIKVSDPITSLDSLAAGPPGVYPVTITLTDADGFVALDSVTTQVLYFPEETEVPLNTVVAWPITTLPARGASGTFIHEDLEQATAPDGWMTGLLDAFEGPGVRGLRVGLVPSPRVVDELADMSDGFVVDDGEERALQGDSEAAQSARSTLTRIRGLFEDVRFQAIHTPYAMPDLTFIDDFEQLTGQLSAAQTVLQEHLGVPADSGWLFPPAGRLDEITLDRLHSSDAAASTFFGPDAIEPVAPDASVPCKQFSNTCPVVVSTAQGRSRGYLLDPDLQARFGALVQNPNDVTVMQELFAELAMIWAELPGVSSRVVAVAVPPMWHPSPAVAARFVKTLARGPWRRTRTPRGGLHLGIGAAERELIPEAAPGRGEPDLTYRAAVDDAADVVESFARIQPPIGLVQRLRRDVLVAQSILWWGDDATSLETGLSYARDAREEAENDLSKISIAGRTDITLASKRGALPLSLQNSTDHDVTVEIRLESPDRDLELSERVLQATFPPGATPLAVQAGAGSSGIYPVRVRVLATDGYEIFETSISIRSTEFNEIALAITLGAFVFLVLFSATRAFRRRKNPPVTEETT